MKSPPITSISTTAASVIIFTMLIARSEFVYAQAALSKEPEVYFSCKVISGTPITVARLRTQEVARLVPATNKSSIDNKVAPSPENTTISILQWNRRYYSETKETSLERCNRVSNLIQNYNSKGVLNYITSGEMDNKRSVCAAKNESATCSLLIFTLDEDENPDELLKIFRDVLRNPKTLSSPDNPNAIKWYGSGGSGKRRGYSRSSNRSAGDR